MAVAATVGAAVDLLRIGMGHLVTAIGKVVEASAVMLGAFRDLVDVFKGMPASMRPAWADGFIKGVENAQVKWAIFGKDLQGLGANATATKIGDTYSKYMLTILKLWNAKPPDADALGGGKLDTSGGTLAKFSKAIERGTKDDYTIRMQNKFGLPPNKKDANEENGKKIDKVVSLLDRIDKRIGAVVVEVV